MTLEGFSLIRPAVIDDAALTSSDVIEAPPSLWSSGTTYASAALVSVAVGTVRNVYRSLLAGNLNHAPAASPTWWKLVGSTYSPWAVGTTYGDGDRVIVVGVDSHHVYESLAAANTGHAVTETAWWLDVGATNRWRMFDAAVTSQTANPDSIAVVLAVPGRADCVALQNINAAEARIVMTDAVDGVVYDETFSLISDSGVADWYAYYFEPIERADDLTVIGLPIHANAELSITLSDPGAVVTCGACVIGLEASIGGTQYGGSVGITDYSRKQANDFGDFEIVPRPYAKRGSFSVLIPRSSIDRVRRLLSGFRAQAIVYVADDESGSTVILGFFRDFSIVIDGPDIATCSIEIEGIS